MKNLLLLLACLAAGPAARCQYSWSLSNVGIPPSYVPMDMATAPGSNTFLLCAGYGSTSFLPRLLSSADAGATWSETTMSGVTGLELPNTIHLKGSKLLMGGSTGSGSSVLFASTDNGVTWTPSSTGIPTTYSILDLATSPTGDIYLAASSAGTAKLLRSTDDGATWSEITTSGLSVLQNVNTLIFSGSRLLLGGSNSTTTTFYVHASTDNGATWTLSNSGIPAGYSPSSLTVAPSGNVYLACSVLGVGGFSPALLASSDNGTNWTEVTPLTGLTDMRNTHCIESVGSKLLLGGSTGTSSVYSMYASELPPAAATIVRNDNGFSVYPNPCRDRFEISPAKPGAYQEMTLTDNAGRQVLHIPNLAAHSAIDVTALAPGAYFVTVTQAGTHERKLLIKQ